jgi:hypothetical protein
MSTVVKFSQLPATTTLDGTELVMITQSGTSRRTTISDIVGGGVTVRLGGELAFTAAAGANNNVALGSYNRLLVNTNAGVATITGIAAGSNGQLCVVTNQGSNDLTLAVQSGSSTAANRLYGVTDLTLPAFGSKLLSYSTTLSRWVIV